MAIRTESPHELGTDRLVNAVAAYDKCGGACVVADFGTTINFDAVSARGEFLGGVIAPGVDISLEALHQRTAKLPKVDLTAPERAIGRDTLSAVRSGVVYGFAGSVDGIVGRIREELGDEATAIATGGLARTIAPFCDQIDEIDDLLTLTGLRLIWERRTPAEREGRGRGPLELSSRWAPGRRRPSTHAPLTIPGPWRATGVKPAAAGAARRHRQLVRAAPGAALRRRARDLRDGLELRAEVRRRAHAPRVPAHPPRRAPGVDPAVRPRRRGDVRIAAGIAAEHGADRID